jgi:hypothetical protein
MLGQRLDQGQAPAAPGDHEAQQGVDRAGALQQSCDIGAQGRDVGG